MGRSPGDNVSEPVALSIFPSTDEVLQNAGPFGTQLGLGSVAGYAAGVAVRVAGTLGFALAGGAFIALQGLQYKGYIAVDWHKVEREMAALMDGDTVTTRDVQAYWTRFSDVLAFGLPGGAGFSLGLAYGVGGRMGKLLAMGAAVTAGPTLTTSYLYKTSQGFREAVEGAAPGLGEELRRRALGGGVGGSLGGFAGDAVWRASVVGARGDLRRLRELEQEVKDAGALGRRGKPGGLDRATMKARLKEIEERKKRSKAEAKT